MASLRTTLSLEPDVAERVRRELASGRRSLKEVINERLRAGFGMAGRTPVKAFRVRPHASAYRPGVDRAKLNQLVDDLAVEAFATARSRRRRGGADARTAGGGSRRGRRRQASSGA